MQRQGNSIEAANQLTTAYDVPIRHPVFFEDDTLRDGEQTVGVCFGVESKVEISRLLLEAGMHRMIVGFPAVSDEERRSVQAVLALGFDDRHLSCLSRATTSDIDAVVACGAKNISLFVPISDLHLRYKLQCDENTALERTAKAVSYARDRGFRNVCVGLEDATRAPASRILRFAEGLIEAGANEIGLCDTVGILTPLSTHGIVRALVDALGDVSLGVHFHNDLGMAAANAIVACQAGASVICGSFAGLGERAGNVCLSEVATILRVKFGLDLGIDLAKLAAAGIRIGELAKMPIAPCKPILGAKVFSHESGIHVHGITSDPATYEAFPPELVGRRHEIHYGKHSGLHSIRYLAQKYGIEASDEDLTTTLDGIKKQTVEHGCPSPDEAAAILRSVVARAKPVV